MALLKPLFGQASRHVSRGDDSKRKHLFFLLFFCGLGLNDTLPSTSPSWNLSSNLKLKMSYIKYFATLKFSSILVCLLWGHGRLQMLFSTNHFHNRLLWVSLLLLHLLFASLFFFLPPLSPFPHGKPLVLTAHILEEEEQQIQDSCGKWDYEIGVMFRQDRKQVGTQMRH